jgi:hypothetical protein
MNNFKLYYFSRGFYFILCSFLFVFVSVTSVSAQLTAEYTILTESNFLSDNHPGEKAKMSMGIFDLGLYFPLYEKADEETGKFFSLENSVFVRRHTFDLNLPQGEEEYFPGTLYAINYTISAVKSLGSSWIAIPFISTGIYSDFKNVDSDHFNTEGGVIIAKKFSNGFIVGIGPVFTYAFGIPQFIPAPFASYTSGNEKFTLDIQIPKSLLFNYKFSERFSSGAAVRFLYSNYSLGDNQAVDENGKSTVAVFSDITFVLESSLLLFKPLYFDFALGTTINRKLIVNDNEANELFDRTMEHCYVINFGLRAGF